MGTPPTSSSTGTSPTFPVPAPPAAALAPPLSIAGFTVETSASAVVDADADADSDAPGVAESLPAPTLLLCPSALGAFAGGSSLAVGVCVVLFVASAATLFLQVQKGDVCFTKKKKR